VAVAQFLAVAATAGFFCFDGVLMMRNSFWARSLLPKPSGVCRNKAVPIAVTVSRLPLAAAAL
jgi:hypothetical protein